MNLGEYPLEVQLFIKEFINEGIFSEETMDKSFINYLYTQRYDKDYIDCIKHDKYNNLFAHMPEV